MFSFTDTFNWLVQNNGMALVGLLCAAIFLQVIDWYLKFQLPQVLLKILKCLMRHPGIGVVFLFVIVVISALAEETRKLWSHGVAGESGVAPWSGEATRSLGLALGALAALYGLVLASKRLDTAKGELEVAKKQADLNIKQARTTQLQNKKAKELDREKRSNFFNERIINTNTQLSNGSVESRCSTILLLEKYSSESKLSQTEVYIVIQTLQAFVKGRTADPTISVGDLNVEKYEWAKLKENRLQRRDLELAISALTRLVLIDDSYNGLSLQGLDLRGLDLRGLNFSFFNFGMSNLSGVDFSNSIFEKTYFMRSRLENTLFVGAQCINTKFNYAYLRGSNFEYADLRDNTTFVYANLENARIQYPSNFDVIFNDTDISGVLIDIEEELTVLQMRNLIYETTLLPSIKHNRDSIYPDELERLGIRSYKWKYKYEYGRWEADFGEGRTGTTLLVVTPWWKQLDPPPSDI